MSAVTARPAGREIEVIAVIGFAHGVSHFFHFMLPALFPWLMRDFALSFTEAGAMMTVFFVVSGAGQALAGFVVDRIGARRVLLAGMALFALAAAGLAMAQDYPTLLLVAGLAGLGNSVFHPADFTVLNRNVAARRLGHAFSVHGLAGNLGWALGPVVMTGIALAADWRTAAWAAVTIALAAALLIFARRDAMNEPPPSAVATPELAPATFAFLASGAVWMCFLFFFLVTMAFGALQNYAPSVLQQVYGLSLVTGASALTAFLLGSAAGTVAGGFLAARQSTHERLIALVLGVAAAFAVVLASGKIPAASVLPVMVAMGFCGGVAGPSRDLLVRRAAIARFGQRAFGRVYGFVYSGLDIGLAIAPLIFGLLMDGAQFAVVLGGVALLQGLAVLTALRVGHNAR